MKKLFRTLLTAIIAIGALCACVFAAACTNDGKDTKSDYNFTVVYADGKAVNGNTDGAQELPDNNGNPLNKVRIQMCYQLCEEYTSKTGKSIDENGKISFSQQQINEIFGSQTDVTEFTFHIWNVKDCPGGEKGSYVIAVNGKGDYTLTLNDNYAE